MRKTHKWNILWYGRNTKKVFEGWIKNLRQRSCNNLLKLLLSAKVCQSTLWLFLKITLKFSMVFFWPNARDFTHVRFLVSQKVEELCRVIFWIPHACSCNHNSCVSTLDGSLKDLCLRFLIWPTHLENDFFFQKWRIWYKAFSHNLYFKRKKKQIVQLPHPDQ